MSNEITIVLKGSVPARSHIRSDGQRVTLVGLTMKFTMVGKLLECVGESKILVGNECHVFPITDYQPCVENFMLSDHVETCKAIVAEANDSNFPRHVVMSQLQVC